MDTLRRSNRQSRACDCQNGNTLYGSSSVSMPQKSGIPNDLPGRICRKYSQASGSVTSDGKSSRANSVRDNTRASSVAIMSRHSRSEEQPQMARFSRVEVHRIRDEDAFDDDCRHRSKEFSDDEDTVLPKNDDASPMSSTCDITKRKVASVPRMSDQEVEEMADRLMRHTFSSRAKSAPASHQRERMERTTEAKAAIKQKTSPSSRPNSSGRLIGARPVSQLELLDMVDRLHPVVNRTQNVDNQRKSADKMKGKRTGKQNLYYSMGECRYAKFHRVCPVVTKTVIDNYRDRLNRLFNFN